MSAAPLELHPLRQADIGLCADWLVREERLLPKYHERIGQRMRTLLAHDRIKGVLIRNVGSKTAERVLAIGLSGFARPQHIDRHLQAPQPFLFTSLIIDEDESSAFLDRRSIARANAGGGLDLVAHLMFGDWDLSSPLWRQVGTMAHTAYVKDHSGYRINRVLQEDWQRQFDIYLATGYRLHSTFQLRGGSHLSEPHELPRHLYFADTAYIGAQVPGTSLSFVLQRVTPRCGFTASEQRLLTGAARGLTDAQLVKELHLSRNTIKTLWRSIYDRVRVQLPELLDNGDAEGEAPTRGVELRRSVVAYVQHHPEELRPFEAKRSRR